MDIPDRKDLQNYANQKKEPYIPNPILYVDSKENSSHDTPGKEQQSPVSRKRRSKKKREELDIERQFGKDLINEIAPLSSNQDKETSKLRREEASSKLTPASQQEQVG